MADSGHAPRPREMALPCEVTTMARSVPSSAFTSPFPARGTASVSPSRGESTMPIVFGEQVSSVEEIVDAFRRHGDAVRGTYRARYVFDGSTESPYSAASLERPDPMKENPADVIYPWEQI